MTMEVVVREVRQIAEAIKTFVLARPDGGALPAFEAGAHVDVHLPGDLLRQYSLCGDPAWTESYQLAVLREASGRGGSAYMFDTLAVGDRLMISEPRNHFPLNHEGGKHLLVAGGIGVTPIRAMIKELQAAKTPFFVTYCAKSPEQTAFREEFEALAEAGLARLHYDGGDPAAAIDFADLLDAHADCGDLYFCGPGGFMQALRAEAETRADLNVHFEYFAGDGSNAEAIKAAAGGFTVHLKQSGKSFHVPEGETVLNVLRDNGFEVASSCEEGFCGACMTRYLSGEPRHVDLVLTDEQRKEWVMICCAGCRSPVLELDL